MKLRSLAMTFAALVLFAVNSLAQVSTLQGTVTGLDGKPVVGALVKIHRTDIKWDPDGQDRQRRSLHPHWRAECRHI